MTIVKSKCPKCGEETKTEIHDSRMSVSEWLLVIVSVVIGGVIDYLINGKITYGPVIAIICGGIIWDKFMKKKEDLDKEFSFVCPKCGEKWTLTRDSAVAPLAIEEVLDGDGDGDDGDFDFDD